MRFARAASPWVPGPVAPLHGPAVLLRALVAALLVPALFVGSLDLHATELPHSALAGPSEVLSGARHPQQPEHLESSGSTFLPSCSTCLLQLKSSCEALELPAPAPAPTAGAASPALPDGAPERVPGLALRSRAPPAA